MGCAASTAILVLHIKRGCELGIAENLVIAYVVKNRSWEKKIIGTLRDRGTVDNEN